MRILVIEDDEFKRRNLVSFLLDRKNTEVVAVGAVNSGVKELRHSEYEIVVTDMSLPTFDISGQEPGGRPQGFGGREILRQIDRFGIKLPVVVVTQYTAFDGPNEYRTFAELEEQLRNEPGSNFVGMVFYDSSSENWKQQLTRILDSISINQ